MLQGKKKMEVFLPLLEGAQYIPYIKDIKMQT